MNGFEKRTQKIKERIMKVTLEMLSTMEPRAIRISDIVEEAKVSQVTIYNHFGSKEALINEALQSWYIQSVEEIEQHISNQDLSFKETLEILIFYKKESVQKYSASRLNEWLLQDPEMKEYVNQVYKERVRPLLLQMINKAKRRGEIQRNLPESMILFYMNMFKEEAENFTQFSASYESEEAFAEDMMHLFFYGLAGN